MAIGCETAQCLLYRLDPDARWSNGTPVTADDFIHTHELMSSAGAPGHGAISSVEAIDPATVLVTFESPYGGWQDLFSRILPAGSDLSELVDLPTSGPFTFVDWHPGESVVLERNPEWWADADPLGGEPAGDVNQLTFVFFPDPEEMTEALEDGEVDVIALRPEPDTIAELSGIEEIEIAPAPGPFWEHIGFHHDDPLLSQPWLREAISLAIDRERILDETVRLVDTTTEALDNTIWMQGTPHYEAHFEGLHDPTRAEQLLAENGCEPGENEVMVCDGTPLSFTWASTDDDPARQTIFDLVREDLAGIGIELVGEFVSPSRFVTREFLFGGPDVWQMVNFSWRARPDPAAANPTYYCGGSLNVTRYCSEDVEALIRQTDITADPEERAELYNRADEIYLADRAVIPLYQKPNLMAWTTEIDGPVPNYTGSEDLWNVGSWAGKESVIVALSEEPAVIDPLSWDEDSANVILGALLYGARGMNPSHEHVPALVESVELLTGGS